MAKRRGLSKYLQGGLGKPKSSSTGAVGPKGPRGLAPTRLPGQRGTGSQNIARPPGNERRKTTTNFGVSSPAAKGIQWGATKKNTVAGNPREGSEYQEGRDPVTGQIFHRYAAEAGGLPAETFGLKTTPAQKAAAKKRRGLRSKMK